MTAEQEPVENVQWDYWPGLYCGGGRKDEI